MMNKMNRDDDPILFNNEDMKKNDAHTVPVCVVIPNYNGRDYLCNCLDSLLKSNPMPKEVIIVDNASSDNSDTEAMNRFCETDVTKLTLIKHEENLGFTGAVNAGINACKEPYVFLLNNDTTIEPDCIGRLYDVMQADSNIFSAGALMLKMDNPDIVDDAGDSYNFLGYPKSFAQGKSKENYYDDRVAKVFSSCAGAAMYRKSILDTIGLFDDLHFAYFEDVDIGFRARVYGYTNVNVRNAVVYHKGSAATGSRHNAFKVSLSSQNSVLVPMKNMPLLQYFCNFPFLLLGYIVKFAYFSLKGLGVVYIKGLMKGFRLGLSKEGRSRHIGFSFKRVLNYPVIQLWIWSVY